MDSQVAVALALSLVGGVSTSIGKFLCSFTYLHRSYCVRHCYFRPIGEPVKSLWIADCCFNFLFVVLLSPTCCRLIFTLSEH